MNSEQQESPEVRTSAGHSQSLSANKDLPSGIWYGIWNLLTYTAGRVLIWGRGAEQGKCHGKSQKQYIWKLQAWGFPLWWLGGPWVVCTQQRRRVVTARCPFGAAACRRGCHLPCARETSKWSLHWGLLQGAGLCFWAVKLMLGCHCCSFYPIFSPNTNLFSSTSLFTPSTIPYEYELLTLEFMLFIQCSP